MNPQERRANALKRRLTGLIEAKKVMVEDIQQINCFALADTTLTFKENWECLAKDIHYAELPKEEDFEAAEKAHILEIENGYEEKFKQSITELKGGEQEEYFKTLKDFVGVVAVGTANSLIIEGTGGIGKTHEVLKTLSDLKVDYEYINSYSTPLGFYQLLYEKNGKVLVLDDFQGILENDTGIAILKAAIETPRYRNRYVSYYSTSDKLKIPSKFEYTGKIIFIVNSLGDNPELNALKTRALYHKVDFSFEDVKKIIMAIAKTDNREEVAEYILTMATPAVKELNLRTLIKGYSLVDYAKSIGREWKSMIDTLLEVDDEKALVLRLHTECSTAKLEVSKWIEETGRSARTYYRLKKDMNLTRSYHG